MIAGVILAAGQSTRLGRPKQLLPLGGQPLLTHVLRNAAAAQLDDVVLVLGHGAAEIAAAVGEWGQRVVINPAYAAGQSTSLRAGLAALSPQTEAALFLLGDQPGVTQATIDAVIAAYRATGSPIVQPRYGDQPGNPVLFARALFPELAAVTGDRGGRAIVRAHAADVLPVDVGAGPPPRDVDTEADYAALLRARPEAAAPDSSAQG